MKSIEDYTDTEGYPYISLSAIRNCKTNMMLEKSSLVSRFVKETDIVRYRKEAKPKGGILADGRGVGKTIEIIGLILIQLITQVNCKSEDSTLIETNATLIICPPHLELQWQEEIKKFAPRLNVVNFTMVSQFNSESVFTNADIVITTTDTLQSIYKSTDSANKNINVKQKETEMFQLHQFHWRRIVADDAHDMVVSHSLASGPRLVDGKSLANILTYKYAWYVSSTLLLLDNTCNPKVRKVLKFLKFPAMDIPALVGKFANILQNNLIWCNTREDTIEKRTEKIKEITIFLKKKKKKKKKTQKEKV